MADKETVIGPETRIVGEVRGDEDLIIRGKVEGKIQLSETLTVDNGGVVQADVDVKILVVMGVVVGTIRASESVRLGDTARVVGDIISPKLTVAAGAAYRGRIDMGEGEVAARPVERKAVVAAKSTAPSRLIPPPRVAAAPPRVVAPTPISASSSIRTPAPAAPPRLTSVAAASRPAPPALPRPDAAAAVSVAPAWAKKKLHRR
jgi:cytoskeletal protein CcmA (bactofilin family)